METSKETLPAVNSEKPLPHSGLTSSTLSESLKQAIKTLDFDWQTTPRGVSVADAEAVLEAVAAKAAVCDPVTASDFASRLMGFYPAREVNDPNTFAAGMAANFSAFPRDIVKRVCDPVKGLPSRLKFLPTIADVREALEAERVKRDRIIGNATWVVREAKRRAEEAAHDARIEAERASMTPEQRKARADAIRARLTTNVIEPEPPRPAPPAYDAG